MKKHRCAGCGRFGKRRCSKTGKHPSKMMECPLGYWYKQGTKVIEQRTMLDRQ